MGRLPIVDEFTEPSEVRRNAGLLLGVVLVLLALGTTMVHSASSAVSAERVFAKEVASARAAELEQAESGVPEVADVGPGSDPGALAVSAEGRELWREASQAPLRSHATKVLMGLVLLVLGASVDYRRLTRWSLTFYLFTLLLLVAVFVPGIGHKVNGSWRWLDPGLLGFAFQPSELAKLAVVVLIATLLSRRSETLDSGSFFSGFLPMALVVLVPAALILVEPDFGTCLLVGFLGFSLLLLAGARLLHLFYLGATAVPAVVWMVMNRGSYVQDRFRDFQNPEPTSQLGFAMSALKVGGLTGVGLGEGRHKLFYLSEIEDDFILALIGEELGFIGLTVVLGLFALLFWSGARILLGVRNRFGFFVVAGVLLTVVTQALINLAVCTGKVPVKGMPLPFVSAGGSSITVLCLGVGLILSIARHPDRPAVHLGAVHLGSEGPLGGVTHLGAEAVAVAGADRGGHT